MTFKLIKIFFSILIILPATLGEVQLSYFFNYGAQANDRKLKAGDDDFGEVDLKKGVFHFFNTSYDKVFVNLNGGISFGEGVRTFTPNCGPSDIPMIIPYWADINTIHGGNVWYREITPSPGINNDLINKASAEVHYAYPHLGKVAFDWMFVCTWDEVPFFGATAKCGGIDKRNYFQAILVSDGTTSYVMFFFNKIEYTTGTASKGDCNGLGGTPAKSGFDLGDKKTFFQLPGSCTADIMDVTTTSNVGQPGKWIFKVDTSFESAPESGPEVATTAAEEQDDVGEITTPQSDDVEETTTPESGDVEETTTPQSGDVEETTTPEADDVEETTTSDTEDIEGSTSPEPITPTNDTNQPDGCDPYNCDNLGYCRHYSICSTASRTWEEEKCPPLLFWNPRHRSGVNPHMECIGGCDYWRNLDEDTKVAYYKDHNCQTHYHQIHRVRTWGRTGYSGLIPYRRPPLLHSGTKSGRCTHWLC